MNSPSLQDKSGELFSSTKKSLSWLSACLVSMQVFAPCVVCGKRRKVGPSGPPLGAQQAQ